MKDFLKTCGIVSCIVVSGGFCALWGYMIGMTDWSDRKKMEESAQKKIDEVMNA